MSMSRLRTNFKQDLQKPVPILFFTNKKLSSQYSWLMKCASALKAHFFILNHIFYGLLNVSFSWCGARSWRIAKVNMILTYAVAYSILAPFISALNWVKNKYDFPWGLSWKKKKRQRKINIIPSFISNYTTMFENRKLRLYLLVLLSKPHFWYCILSRTTKNQYNSVLKVTSILNRKTSGHRHSVQRSFAIARGN